MAAAFLANDFPLALLHKNQGGEDRSRGMKGYEERANLFWNQTYEFTPVYTSGNLRRGEGEDWWTDLDASRRHVRHVELSCKIPAHDTVGFLVMDKGPFEDL